MNPMLANRIEKKFYQLIAIDDKAVSQITEKLSTRDIHLNQILSGSVRLCLVEAPNELPMLLRKSKGYELRTFNNDEFVLLIKYIIKYGASIKEIEFLGENYFEEDLNEELEKVIYLQNNDELLNIIDHRSLKVTKFIAEKNRKIVFYRSGLIYSDESLYNLSGLLRSFFEERECLM